MGHASTITQSWFAAAQAALNPSANLHWLPGLLGGALVLCFLLMRIWHAKLRGAAAMFTLRDAGSTLANDEQYRAYILHSAQAIWRYELEKPVPVALSEDQQIEMLYRDGYLAECNPAMARVYGFDSPEQMIGLRLNEIVPRDNPHNLEFLRRFIRSGYQLVDAVSFGVDRDGKVIYALTNMAGIIEDGCGVRVWGISREISEHIRRVQDAQARERQQRAVAELSQMAVASSDVHAVLERAAALVRQTLDVSGAAVVEYAADSGRWHVTAMSGFAGHDVPKLEHADVQWMSLGALHTGPDEPRTIVIGDSRSSTHGELARRGICSALVVIIRGPNEVFGVLGAYNEGRREFSSDEIRFIEALAGTIGAATLRHAADEALRRSEAQHRAILAQVKDYAIFMVDAAGRAASWTEGVKRVLGYDEAEFVGQPIHRLYTRAALARDIPRQELVEAAHAGSTSNDRWMMRKDGRRFWASGITTCNRDAHGRVVGYTRIMRDLTDQRRVVQRLRKSRRSLTAAQRIARIGNWELDLRNLTDLNANRLRWSKEAFRIFGFQPGEVEPTNALFFSLVPSDDQERIIKAVQSALHGAGNYSIDHRIVLRDGVQKQVHEQAEVMYDRNGRPRRMIGTVQDITAQKQAEAELDQHRNHLEQLVAQRSHELEESQRRLRLNERMVALGTLSTGLGHDMGNLLLPIRVRLDAMEQRLNGQVTEDVQAIRTATDYLQRLSNGLRLLAADWNGAVGASETTELSSWWQDAEPILKNSLPRGVSLTSEFPANAPAVRVPRHHLTQAVFNLVQNAGDAFRAGAHTEGGGKVRVWARADRAEAATPTIQIGVTDNGPGMNFDVKRRCLEPFFTTKTRAISTGLGLALVHGMVQKAGGEIDIRSQPGQGATFIMKLPAADRAPIHPGALAHRPRAVVSLSDERLTSYLRSLLVAWQYEVVEADEPDGRGAELWIAAASPRGAEAARQFVAEARARRVVLIGNAPERIDDGRILQFSSQVDAALLRKALREIATTQTSME